MTRFNYLGDWGTQFGLMAVGLEMFGDEPLRRQLGLGGGEEMGEESSISANSSADLSANSSANSVKPLTRLMDIYVKVNELAEEDENIR